MDTLGACSTVCRAEAQSLESSNVWYAPELRALFPDGLVVVGQRLANDRLGALRIDITHFSVTTRRVGAALIAEGSITLEGLPSGVETFLKPHYLLRLQGYLLDPSGRLVWSQTGFPQGDAWIPSGGATRNFRLVKDLGSGPSSGTLILLAIGEPLVAQGAPELYMILGAKKLFM